MVHAQTSTVAGADDDERDSSASGRSEGISNDDDVEPFIFPASGSSVLDDDFALGEFDAEAQAIAQQVRGSNSVCPHDCSFFLP